jgi:hypothetical protein
MTAVGRSIEIRASVPNTAISSPQLDQEFKCYFTNTDSAKAQGFESCEEYDLNLLTCGDARENFLNVYHWDPFTPDILGIVTRIEVMFDQMNKAMPNDSLGHQILDPETLHKIRDKLTPLCDSIDPSKFSNGLTAGGLPISCNAFSLEDKHETLWNDILNIFNDEILVQDPTADVLVQIKDAITSIVGGHLFKLFFSPKLAALIKDSSFLKVHPVLQSLLQGWSEDVAGYFYNEYFKTAFNLLSDLGGFIDELTRVLAQTINNNEQATLVSKVANAVINSQEFQSAYSERMCDHIKRDVDYLSLDAVDAYNAGTLCTSKVPRSKLRGIQKSKRS